MLIATRRSHEWRMDASYLISHALGCQIVSKLDKQWEHSSATNMSLVQIGMSNALCLSSNTQSLSLPRSAVECSMLIAVLSRAVEVSPRMISMLEAFALSMGALTRQQVQHLPDDSGHIESCAVCDRLRQGRSSWLRWDEYMDKQLQIQLTHTVCPACVSTHYPDLQEQGQTISVIPEAPQKSIYQLHE